MKASDRDDRLLKAVNALADTVLELRGRHVVLVRCWVVLALIADGEHEPLRAVTDRIARLYSGDARELHSPMELVAELREAMR